LSALMEQALGAKPRRHQFGPDYFPGRPMTALGG
jgi:hypothetical protein